MVVPPRSVTAQLLIKADAEVIYDFLATPANHAILDGSGTVTGEPGGPDRISAGDTFTMGMQRGPARYRSANVVVEAVPGEVLAWQTIGRWRGRTIIGGQIWRYDLRPHERGTVVRHTFDWSEAKWPRVIIELPRFPQRASRTLPLSLERLARGVEPAS